MHRQDQFMIRYSDFVHKHRKFCNLYYIRLPLGCSCFWRLFWWKVVRSMLVDSCTDAFMTSFFFSWNWEVNSMICMRLFVKLLPKGLKIIHGDSWNWLVLMVIDGGFAFNWTPVFNFSQRIYCLYLLIVSVEFFLFAFFFLKNFIFTFNYMVYDITSTQNIYVLSSGKCVLVNEYASIQVWIFRSGE